MRVLLDGVFNHTGFVSRYFNGDGFYGPSELNMMEEEQFLRMVREFGADRLVFGTDSPWGGQAEDVARFRALPLTDEEKAAILGGNAQKLLGLS